MLMNFSKTEILKSYLLKKDEMFYNKKLNIEEHLTEIFNL
jgi:hypothetical protein